MKTKLGRAAAFAAVVIALSGGLNGPAQALPAGVAAVHATSSISPRLGVTLPPTQSTIAFGGGATGVINGTARTCGLNVSLPGTATLLSMNGTSGNVSCAGAVSFSCSVTSHVYNIGRIAASGTCTGAYAGGFQLHGVLTPTSANATTFVVVGDFVGGGIGATNLAFTANGTWTPSPAPAIETVPRAVTLTMNGTAAGVFGTTAGLCSLSYTGTGLDSLIAGNGSGTLKCTDVGININCLNTSWTRVGTVAVFSGSCTGTAAGALNMVGAFVPLEGSTTAMFFDGALAVA